jgi:hypothetical protein
MSAPKLFYSCPPEEKEKCYKDHGQTYLSIQDGCGMVIENQFAITGGNWTLT